MILFDEYLHPLAYFFFLVIKIIKISACHTLLGNAKGLYSNEEYFNAVLQPQTGTNNEQ